MNGNNRFEGYFSKQRYDKPNRGANNLTTQESNSKELDTFVITQLSYNLVLSSTMFLDSKVSYNNTHFPLYQKTDMQPLTDNTSNVLYRNRNNTALMFRRRAQVVAEPALLRAGIARWPPRIQGRLRQRIDAGRCRQYPRRRRQPHDVEQRAGPRANTVQIFNSRPHVERAVMTAVYGQDGTRSAG